MRGMRGMRGIGLAARLQSTPHFLGCGVCGVKVTLDELESV